MSITVDFSRLTSVLGNSCPACRELEHLGRRCPECDEVGFEASVGIFSKRAGQDQKNFLKLHSTFGRFRRGEAGFDEIMAIASPMQSATRELMTWVTSSLARYKVTFEDRDYVNRALRIAEKLDARITAFLKRVRERQLFEAEKELELMRKLLQDMDLLQSKAKPKT